MLDAQIKGLIFDIEQSLASADNVKDIITFVDTEIDKQAWGIDLNLQQRAILKAYYQLSLTEAEASYLEDLKIKDKTTWDKNSSEPYQYLVLDAGRRGSKSLVASVIACYEFYKLCHIPQPQLHFGIGANTPITIFILATTAEQAQGTIYSQICGLFPLIKYFKTLIDKKLVTVGAEEINYSNKRIEIKSGNSKSSSQVGYSTILLVMDEMARIEGTYRDGDVEILNAIRLWNNIGASGISFGSAARRVACSSAWFVGDAVDLLYHTALVNPTYLGFRLATWELNPKYDRNNPVVAADYAANPRTAALEYEGIRTLDTQGFFDGEEISRCFMGDTTVVTEFASPSRKNELVIKYVVPSVHVSCGYLDPAITKDSYAFAYGHKETVYSQDGYLRPKYFVDGILVWEPNDTNKVSIVHVQDCIQKVHAKRPIFNLGADHHNSAETVERLTRQGIPSKVYTATAKLQLEQYNFARQLMHEERLILPRSSPWRHKLTDELTRVTLIRGTKIDHPKNGGSKDIADAVCGLCWLLEQTKTFNQVEVVEDIPASARPITIPRKQTAFSSSRQKLFNQRLF